MRTCQINHTMTRRKGTVRGMHFQRPPHAEIKLVACLRGVVFDVAVDLRRGSPTFLQWHAEVLSADDAVACSSRGFRARLPDAGDDCELLYRIRRHHAIGGRRAASARSARSPSAGRCRRGAVGA